MHVFVLTVGRTGSVSFTAACGHLTNYMAAHESNIAKVTGPFQYPDQHIEVDNRLAWFLPFRGRDYPDAYYVHVTRDRDEVARSHAVRSLDRLGVEPGLSSSESDYGDAPVSR
ncbi:MAG: hypothetical protein ACR2K2_09665 [Mycobacteriales bacterium]